VIILSYEENKGLCKQTLASGDHFQAIQILASKAGALKSTTSIGWSLPEWSNFQVLLSTVGSWPYRKYWMRRERLAKVEHSSLFCHFLSDVKFFLIKMTPMLIAI
jgi:hypothetical protein